MKYKSTFVIIILIIKAYVDYLLSSNLGLSLKVIDVPSRKIYHPFLSANELALAAQTSVCPSSPGQSIYCTISLLIAVTSAPILGNTSKMRISVITTILLTVSNESSDNLTHISLILEILFNRISININ